MASLDQKSGGGRSGLLELIIAIVLSVAFLTLWSGEGETGALHTAKTVTNTVAAPFQVVGSVLSVPFRAMGNGMANASADTATLLELQEQNNLLRAQNAQLEELLQENKRLSDLLGMKSTLGLTAIGAKVIGVSSDSWNRSVVIDKGTLAGLNVGMPVTDGSGLAGQVVSVTPTTSTVRLLSDEASGVSVTLQGSRSEGILTGSVDGLLYIEFVPSAAEVKVGETVLTSGMGGVYPKGIMVGTVARVSGSVTDTYHTIVVEPLAALEVTEEVLVLTGNETETAAAERGPEAENLTVTKGDEGE